jgi:hypothetical protein
VQDKNRFALKEWAIVLKALSEGQQIIVLRKGGLIEKKKHFTVEHREFFIYPTYLHQQREGVVPGKAQDLEQLLKSQPSEAEVILLHYAVVHDAIWITDPDVLKRLEGHHLFSFQEVSKRYSNGKTPGLNVILLRVYRLLQPFRLPVLPHYAGCKSWVDLEVELPTIGSGPVLDDDSFRKETTSIETILNKR